MIFIIHKFVVWWSTFFLSSVSEEDAKTFDTKSLHPAYLYEENNNVCEGSTNNLQE